MLIAGKYRLYAVTGNDDGTNIPADVQEILAVAHENNRSDAQTGTPAELLQFRRTRIKQPYVSRWKTWNSVCMRLRDAFEVMVMNAMEKAAGDFYSAPWSIRPAYRQGGTRDTGLSAAAGRRRPRQPFGPGAVVGTARPSAHGSRSGQSTVANVVWPWNRVNGG